MFSMSSKKCVCMQMWFHKENELRLTVHYSKRVPLASNRQTAATKACLVASEICQHLCMHRGVNVFAPLMYTVCKTFQTIEM